VDLTDRGTPLFYVDIHVELIYVLIYSYLIVYYFISSLIVYLFVCKFSYFQVEDSFRVIHVSYVLSSNLYPETPFKLSL
jgi:hypothetical protein